MEAFFRRLHGQALSRDNKDIMSWWVSKKGFFTIKSFYSNLVPCNGREFPSILVWNPWVPKRVNFFAWEAIWGRILTMDQLKRSGWILPSRCFLCKEEESANHVLIHCPKVAMISHLIFALFGVQWVMPNSIKETILSWNDSFVGKKRKKAWNAAPLCLFWTLWKERNRKVFKDTELADQVILWSFLYMFSDWVRAFSILLIGWDVSKAVVFYYSFSFWPCCLVCIMYTFRCTSSFLNTIAFTYQKKKKVSNSLGHHKVQQPNSA